MVLDSQGHKKNVWPAVVLIENRNGRLHWVTVVRVEYNGEIDTLYDDPRVAWKLKDSGCRVYFNTWDDQYVAECTEFTNGASRLVTGMSQVCWHHL